MCSERQRPLCLSASTTFCFERCSRKNQDFVGVPIQAVAMVKSLKISIQHTTAGTHSYVATTASVGHVCIIVAPGILSVLVSSTRQMVETLMKWGSFSTLNGKV
mmetsp:Transcript_41610/g.72239  ORF Transcript_41610/g.72239 Transcript_41610/m.72239 type:complete len:104 (-) Transcript_41610:263-574(-)